MTITVSSEALPKEDKPSTSTSRGPYELHKNIAATDVAVTVEDGTLHVRAGRFAAYYTLPEDAEISGAQASCVHGVLTVRLPRAPLPAETRIAVASSADLQTPADALMHKGEGTLAEDAA